jgi:hypothetical protein
MPGEHGRDRRGGVRPRRKVSSSSASRLTVTRCSPAAASGSAKRGSSTPLVVIARSSRPSIAASFATRSGRSAQQRLAAGQPDLADPDADEDPQQRVSSSKLQQLLAVEEGVVGAEHLPRHAVGAAQVAPVGDRDAQVLHRPARAGRACRTMDGIVNELAEEYEDRAVVVKANAAEAPDAFIKFNVRGTPTFMVLTEAEEGSRAIHQRYRATGLVKKDILTRNLDQALEAVSD